MSRPLPLRARPRLPEALVSNATSTGESVEAATSLFEGYATTANDPAEPVFEPVHVPPPPTDQSIHSWDFFEKALRHFRQDKPTFVIPSGDTPLWESTDELLLSKLWRHLDPYGSVGVCLDRDFTISLDQQVLHWLNLYDPEFRCDPTFPFIVSNMLRRRDVYRRLVFRVPEDRNRRIAQTLQEIDMTVFAGMVSKAKGEPRYYKTATDEEKRIERVLNDLQNVGDKIHTSRQHTADAGHAERNSGIEGMNINLDEDLLDACGSTQLDAHRW